MKVKIFCSDGQTSVEDWVNDFLERLSASGYRVEDIQYQTMAHGSYSKHSVMIVYTDMRGEKPRGDEPESKVDGIDMEKSRGVFGRDYDPWAYPLG